MDIISYFIHSYNFDGLFHFIGEKDDECSAYFQVYTEGMIELVETRILRYAKKIFPRHDMEDKIIDYTKQSLQFQKEFDVKPPIVLYLALLNVAGYEIPPRLQVFAPRHDLHPVDREDLILPKIIIDKFDIVLEEILKTNFDRIWNACGYKKSEYYDKN